MTRDCTEKIETKAMHDVEGWTRGWKERSDDEQFWLHAQLAQPRQEPAQLHNRAHSFKDAHVGEPNLLRKQTGSARHSATNTH
jgi:hypothetical protein